MVFAQLKAASADDLSALESALPAKILELDGQLAASLSLGEAEGAFAKDITSSHPQPNKIVSEKLALARAETAACVLNLRKIERFIQLHVPTVEDGGNFGVAVQMETLKMVSEKRAALKTLFDGFAAYHKDRAALWKEVAPKVTTEKTESRADVADDETEASDASENKKKTTAKKTARTSEETKNVTATPLPDAVAAITALDVSWYFHVYYALEAVRDAYAVCGDCVAKNRAKLEKPKGEGSNGMTMF